MLQFHNTLTRSKQPFESLEPGRVRMYNCGPTVYSRAHIGNMRAYLFADTLRRWLELSGYEVRQVMNITDVGHLVDEGGGQGEDKIEAQARREGRDPWAISRGYTEQFLADLVALGCKHAAVYPRASEHVPQMLEIIDGLLARGYAYRSGAKGENVYFDVSRFARYGALSGNRVAALDAGARVAVRDDKRQPEDFALWKSDPAHLMKWATHLGPDGFPGWHIECSAMARAHLGDQIDIHTGGEDNIFPHHECEIAQSEAFTGRAFARYWLHTRFLQVDGGKMSKSLGNVWTLDDVRARGFAPRVLRYCLIRGHYRQPLNFTWDILRECASALEGLDDLVRRVAAQMQGAGASDAQAGVARVRAARAKFDAAMDDDLGTPEALAALFELRSAVLEEPLGLAAAGEANALLSRAHEALGVLELGASALEAHLQQLLDARSAARARRDWGESDRLRDALARAGVLVEDTPKGVLWRRASGPAS